MHAQIITNYSCFTVNVCGKLAPLWRLSLVMVVDCGFKGISFPFLLLQLVRVLEHAWVDKRWQTGHPTWKQMRRGNACRPTILVTSWRGVPWLLERGLGAGSVAGTDSWQLAIHWALCKDQWNKSTGFYWYLIVQYNIYRCGMVWVERPCPRVSTCFNMFQHVSTCFNMFQHVSTVNKDKDNENDSEWLKMMRNCSSFFQVYHFNTSPWRLPSMFIVNRWLARGAHGCAWSDKLDAKVRSLRMLHVEEKTHLF